MLDVIGHDSLDSMMAAAVPESISNTEPLGLRHLPTEHGALAALAELAGRNRVVTTLIGAGYHDTHTPAVIARNILENPAWYTAYTPYQPEISQGRLEALLNFQTVVTDLTGMDLANASLLDEATAAAEAMTMARRQSKVTGDTFFVDDDCHPQVIEVVQTRAEPLGIKLVVGDPLRDLDGHEPFGVLLAYPGSSGAVRDLRDVAATAAGAGAVVCVATDLLALTLLTPPGEWGPTSWWAPPSGSACRSASADRTRASWRCASPLAAPCRADWSACRSTPTVDGRSASRCRPGSSTSAARRPRRTSAPLRCCWRSWPERSPPTTAPTDSAPSLAVPMGWPRRRPTRWPRTASSSPRTTCSTPSRPGSPGGPTP